MVHIGKRIEQVMTEKRYSAVWLVKAINCDRRNVYNIFKRKNLDTALLKRISIALHHDFFKDLSDDIAFD